MSASTKSCPLCGTEYGPAATYCQADGARLSTPKHDPFLGRVLLDQFRIEGVMGAGGMGTVYRATQLTLGREVAIKILHPELVTNSDAARRFEREAKIATSLEHPNLVNVYLYGQLPDGSLYLAMELIKGRSINELLEDEGPLPPARVIHIIRQICKGVGVAHRKGIVHRDVKPENVLVTSKDGDPDFVKVLDFGIARMLWDEQSAMTQSGVIFGTARYISPEGAAGEHTDARSDVYSIGVLAYQLLTGHTPFENKTPVALLMSHIHDPPRDIRELGNIPESLAAVIMQTLEKNPEGRFSNAEEMDRALKHVASELSESDLRQVQIRHKRLDETPILPRKIFPEQSLPIKTSRRWLAPFLAFLLGAGLVFAAAWAYTSRKQPVDTEAEVRKLLTQAEFALGERRIDEEGDHGNLLLITNRILTLDPGNKAALGLRREAALILREHAADSITQSKFEDAKQAYNRVLVLIPDDPRAIKALKQLKEAPKKPLTILVEPRSPEVGENVLLTFVLPKGKSFGDQKPSFVVQRGRGSRRVMASEDVKEDVWVASYRFNRAGTYQLQCPLKDETVEVELVVRAKPRSGTRQNTPRQVTEGSSGGFTTMQESSMSTGGIDWTVPGSDVPTVRTMTGSTKPSNEAEVPPAPWTGQ